MDYLLWLIIFIAKLFIIALLSDTWLYWTHRLYHWQKAPQWLQDIHSYHHARFNKNSIFALHWAEWLIAASFPVLVVSYLIHPLFCLFSVPWSAFEAARGHGHFKWFNIIPRWYYKLFGFCGIRYHMVHHEENEHINYGQFLKLWDKIMGTEQVRFTNPKV